MDASAHYRHLLTLGRDDFLAAAAPAVLLRHGAPGPEPSVSGTTTQTLDRELVEMVDGSRVHVRVTPEPSEMEIYPLAKKPGASFRDRITIGRTLNNDVVIADHSVSRLHAYVRPADGWMVADAGSKNGSWLDGARLEPRREAQLSPGAVLRLGEVIAMFYPASDLFDLLGGDHARR
jgi:hypothetical protein